MLRSPRDFSPHVLKKIFVLILFGLLGVHVLFSDSASPDDDSEEEIILRMWGVADPPEVYQDLFTVFSGEHPGLRIEYTQFPNEREYEEILLRQWKKKKGPDLFLFRDDQRERFHPFINPTRARNLQEYPPFVKESLEENGFLLGLPMAMETLQLFYHRRYFRDEPAKQWYDFAEQTRRISIAGFAMGRIDNLLSGWDLLAQLLLQKDIQLKGKESPELLETLTFFLRFADPKDRYFNWSESLNRNYLEQERESFLRGKVAAIAAFPHEISGFSKRMAELKAAHQRVISGKDIRSATMPQFDPEHPQYLVRFQALTVSLFSDHPIEAWELVSFLTSEEHRQQLAEKRGEPASFEGNPEFFQELQRVEQEQLFQASTYRIAEEDRGKLEPILLQALKKRDTLREVLNLEF